MKKNVAVVGCGNISDIYLSNMTKVFDNLTLDGILGNEIFRNRKIQFLNSKGIVRIL
jgi:hypothetical protein